MAWMEFPGVPQGDVWMDGSDELPIWLAILRTLGVKCRPPPVELLCFELPFRLPAGLPVFLWWCACPWKCGCPTEFLRTVACCCLQSVMTRFCLSVNASWIRHLSRMETSKLSHSGSGLSSQAFPIMCTIHVVSSTSALMVLASEPVLEPCSSPPELDCGRLLPIGPTAPDDEAVEGAGPPVPPSPLFTDPEFPSSVLSTGGATANGGLMGVVSIHFSSVRALRSESLSRDICSDNCFSWGTRSLSFPIDRTILCRAPFVTPCCSKPSSERVSISSKVRWANKNAYLCRRRLFNHTGTSERLKIKTLCQLNGFKFW